MSTPQSPSVLVANSRNPDAPQVWLNIYNQNGLATLVNLDTGSNGLVLP